MKKLSLVIIALIPSHNFCMEQGEFEGKRPEEESVIIPPREITVEIMLHTAEQKLIDIIKKYYSSHDENKLRKFFADVIKLKQEFFSLNVDQKKQISALLDSYIPKKTGESQNILPFTSLLVAAVKKNWKNLIELILKVAKPDQDELDMAAAFAVVLRNNSLLETLMNHGVNPENVSKLRRIPLQNRYFVNAAAEGDIQTVKYLLNFGDYGFDVNGQSAALFGGKIKSALSEAAINNHENIVKLLLTHPDIDVNSRGEFGKTPLMAAIENKSPNSINIIKLLLSHPKINLETRNNNIWTALHEAALENRADIIKLLLDHGADIDAKDGGGSTALMLAAESNKEDAVEALLRYGASTHIKTRRGETALMLVEGNRLLDKEKKNKIIQLLKLHGAKE